MTNEQEVYLWKTITWVVPILAAAVIGIAQWRISTAEKKISEEGKLRSKASQEEFENRLNSNLDKRLIDKADAGFPGVCISLLVTFHSLDQLRDKFIFDQGHENNNRYSLFLTKNNDLVFRLLDDDGFAHLLKVPKRLHTFNLEVPYFVLCEVGVSETYSFIRLFINDKEVARSNMDSRLNIVSKPDGHSLKIGGDIFGKNNAKITLSVFSVGEKTFTKQQREDFFNAEVKFHHAIRGK